MTFFDEKKVLITGGGSLGRELVHQLLGRNINEVRILDVSEQQLHKCEIKFCQEPRVSYVLGDVGDYDAVEMAMPDIDFVIHTAACKFVNYVEYHPFQAIRTNVEGTLNVVKASIRSHSIQKVVNISSDKACNPCSIYGLTKALQERFFTWADRVSTKTFCSVRFPNFYGSEGSVIEIWDRQGKEGIPITVTDRRMKRYFVSIKEAAELTLEALEASEGGEIFIPSDVQELSIMEIAEEYSKKFGVAIEFIGKRLGERLHENLMTEEEREMATLEGPFWRIETKKQYLGTPHYLYDTYRER